MWAKCFWETQGNAVKFNLIPTYPHSCACCCWALVVNKPWATWCLLQQIGALESKLTSGAVVEWKHGRNTEPGSWRRKLSTCVFTDVFLSLAGIDATPGGGTSDTSVMCPTWEVSLWHRPPEGAEQGTCLISWAGTECVMPSVLNCSLAFNNSLTNFEWENFLLAITKGLVCSTASAGLSLRGTVRSADWCAFSKCFPAKLALINKIYEGKEKLVLPSWGFSFFFVLMTNLHVQEL